MPEVKDKPCASCRSSTDEEDEDKQFVFLMLLDDQTKKVLMSEEDAEWYLPYYKYPYRSGEHEANACLQFQKSLDFDASRPYFTALFDPLGFMWTCTMHGKETRAYSYLVLVESHCTDFRPQLPAAWHDIDSVSHITQHEGNRSRGPSPEVHESLFDLVKKFLKGQYIPSYLNDISFRPGWFRNASQHLKSLLADIDVNTTDAVFQHSLSSTSIILKVDSDHGTYFLKAPAAGSDEVAIIRAIVQHLPNHTLHVVSTNDDLNCFVSESFESYDDEDPDVQVVMVDKLAQVEIESLACLEDLRGSGLPDRSPRAIIEQINEWLDSDTTLKDLLVFAFQKLVENADAIKKGLMEIEECGIPLTLVHGDAFEHNFPYKLDDANGNIPIMHDWQFSCISHPFFDFHNHEDVSPALIERYLQKWTKFASMNKVRRAFKLTGIIGWIIKFWGVADNLKACDPERCSVLFEFMQDCLDAVVYGLRDMDK